MAEITKAYMELMYTKTQWRVMASQSQWRMMALQTQTSWRRVVVPELTALCHQTVCPETRIPNAEQANKDTRALQVCSNFARKPGSDSCTAEREALVTTVLEHLFSLSASMDRTRAAARPGPQSPVRPGP